MKKLDYSIEIQDYDVLVLGTGMTEALFAASLAKIDRKKVLVVDADSGYSSSQKTLNIKELVAELEKTTPIPQEQIEKTIAEGEAAGIPVPDPMNLKRSFFETLILPETMNEKNAKFQQHAIHESTLFKQFNIDIQPKLLFSTSLTVDCMSQANMDHYMEFRAVDSIYFFESASKKLISTPCSKSDIFKSKDFSLLEKKQLFQFLHKCVSLYRLAFAEKIDQNSIQEFDKEFEVDSATIATYEKFKNESCMAFLASSISSKKVQDVFLYNLCNFDFNPNLPIPQFLQHAYTTKSFLYRLNKYIKSCGIHTALPYIYANYGTGDIPQGYARIGAIFGGIYCINPDIQIASIQKDTEDKHVFNITTNLVSKVAKPTNNTENNSNSEQQEQQNPEPAEAEIQIKEGEVKKPVLPVKQIIAGPEYRDTIRQLIGLPIEDTQRESVKLLRVMLISKKSEQQLQGQAEFDAKDLSDEERANAPYRFSCPIIYSIPPNTISSNKQPIQIVQMDSSTVSAPKTHQVFYCKKILENPANYLEEVNAIIAFVTNIHTYLPAQPFQYSIDYVWAYTQEKTSEGNFERVVLNNDGTNTTSDKNADYKIAFIGQDYFEADMDKNFEEFRDNIEWLSEKVTTKDENYFKTIEEMNGKVDFYQNEIRMEGDESEEQEGIDSYISQFQKLKENALTQQPENNTSTESNQTNQENNNEDDKKVQDPIEQPTQSLEIDSNSEAPVAENNGVEQPVEQQAEANQETN